MPVGARTVLPEMRLVSEALIAGAQTAGLDLIVWDFTARDDDQLLADARVKGVITDDVGAALRALAVRSGSRSSQGLDRKHLRQAKLRTWVIVVR